MLKKLRADLKKVSSPKKAKASAWFFKTGPGQYGEGDVFVGATVPKQREISKKYKDLGVVDIKRLLASKVHEERLIGLFILVLQYKGADDAGKGKIFDFYLKNRFAINNWDLVDSSAPYIAGDYLLERDKSLLYELAMSENLWDRRIAIVSTLRFISNNKFTDALKICVILENDKQDLIHKACGWMLREVGKKDLDTLKKYLDKHKLFMPRTTLRYAIERMTPKMRYHYMNK